MVLPASSLTPISTETPYCSPLQLFQYHDWEQVADLLRDGKGPRPSYLWIQDPTTREGAILIAALMAGSGEIEAACGVAQRYQPQDLMALTGASQAKLQAMTANMSFWKLSQRRQPASSSIKNVPGLEMTLSSLKDLRDGSDIFGFVESAVAGYPVTIQPNLPMDQAGAVCRRASRLFGRHGWTNR